MLHLMLPVLFWSPIEQYRQRIPTLKCQKCNQQCESATLQPHDWNYGQNEKRQARLLYCSETNVILVSRVYICRNGQETNGHHPVIVNSPTLIALLPFSLWNRVGFTIRCTNRLRSLIRNGVFMQKLETFLKQNRLEQFFCRKQQFHQLNVAGYGKTFPMIDDDTQEVNLWIASPSRHSISNCYFHSFQEFKKKKVMKKMSCTSVRESCWVSCDHTFSPVANYFRLNVCVKISFQQLDL